MSYIRQFNKYGNKGFYNKRSFNLKKYNRVIPYQPLKMKPTKNPYYVSEYRWKYNLPLNVRKFSSKLLNEETKITKTYIDE